MKLAMLLYTGPDHHNTSSLIGFAKAARDGGHEVTVFAMADGVMNLVRKDFIGLAFDGVDLTVCENNRHEFSAPEGVQGVKYGSQYDLAGYVQDCDKLISFT